MHDDTGTTEDKMAEVNDTNDTPHFAKAVLYVLIDNVVTGFTSRNNAVGKLADNVFVRYIPQCVNVSMIEAERLPHQYPSELSHEGLAEELQNLPVVHKANVGRPEHKTIELQNLLAEYKL